MLKVMFKYHLDQNKVTNMLMTLKAKVNHNIRFQQIMRKKQQIMSQYELIDIKDENMRCILKA